MRKLIKPSTIDPIGSVSLFDFDRVNDFGSMYCVAAHILMREVDEYWSQYVEYRNEEPIEQVGI
ncbi:MAG: hypothetical protein HGA87_00775 [Desulfobulbaceae bacterium]|nr:hypothetical protein [Desulfobulbaceae bacterium]